MERVRLFFALALMVIAPAGAQVIPPAPMPKTPSLPAPPNLPPRAYTPSDPAQDPERARKVIDELRAKNGELTVQLKRSDARLQDALAQIEKMTSGSAVRAYCRGDTVSVNTAGASENCTLSGYKCAPVEGTCYRRCNATVQCAIGRVCDTIRQACVRP